MKKNTGLLVVLVAGLASATETSAHFKLLAPAPWLTTNNLGDPQKVGPCGGDPKGQNDALLSKAVTKVAELVRREPRCGRQQLEVSAGFGGRCQTRDKHNEQTRVLLHW